MINIIILILISLFWLLSINEHFDFENIPHIYNESVIDIYKSPIVGIPKIIHHIAPTNKAKWHNVWFECYESWMKHFPEPEYTHINWSLTKITNLINDDFPWFIDIYKNYDKKIKKLDIARLFILYKYGGIYADMDYMVYKNFFDELPQDKVSIPESPYKENEFMQNALMCSPPKHNFWLLALDFCYKTKDYYVFEATGPMLLTRTYWKYPELVNVLSMDLYNPHINDKSKYNSNNVITKHLLSNTWVHATD
jgi:mannosyltransferase OCH1-like enzyme